MILRSTNPARRVRNAQPSSASRLRLTQARGLFMVAGLAASLFIAGCDGDTARTRAVEDARIQLLAISTGGETRTPTAYQEVLTKLRPVASQGSSSQNAAASLLIAQAEAGLAEDPMGQAAELELSALHHANAVRSKLAHWQMLSAAAAAAASFDPQPELNAIQQHTRERQQAIADAEANKARIDARAADLRRQAEAKMDEARALLQEDGRLRQQVVNQSAVEGEQTLIRSREISRQASALEVQAAELQAQAEKIEPEIAQTAVRVEGIRHQIARLNEAATEVQERARRAQREASDARAAANTAAQDLHAAVTALEALRSGDLAARYDAALQGYQRAVTAARSATSENRAGANTMVGAAQQAIGDIHWSRSHGQEFYLETLDALINAQPALPQAQQYRQLAERGHTARQEALAAATQAYEAAYEAFNAAGSGEGMNRVTGLLNDIVKKTSGGSRDLSAGRAMDPMDEAGEMQELEWTGAAMEPGYSPQETLATLMSGMLDGNPAIIDLFYVDGPRQRQVLESMLGIFPTYNRFTQAMVNQFGSEAADALKDMSAQAPGMMDLMTLDPAEMDFQIDGDRAEAALGDGESIKLREVDGRWLVDISEQLSGPEAQMMTAMLPQLRQALEGLTADVEAGKFNNEQEVMAALMMKLMSAFGG